MIETVFRTPWFAIESWPLDGGGHPFYRIVHEDGVVVAPVTKDQRFVLIRQYRPALERFTLEFPAGGVGAGEAPEQAARRELYEETGYHAPVLKLAVEGTLRLEREKNLNHFFIAPDVELDPAFAPKERIETVLTSFSDFRELVLSGGFDHLAALPALLVGAWRYGFDWGRQ